MSAVVVRICARGRRLTMQIEFVSCPCLLQAHSFLELLIGIHSMVFWFPWCQKRSGARTEAPMSPPPTPLFSATAPTLPRLTFTTFFTCLSQNHSSHIDRLYCSFGFVLVSSLSPNEASCSLSLDTFPSSGISSTSKSFPFFKVYN